MPVWVQLYNVPLELYTRLGLSYIASGLGVPLYMDSITASRERLEFAKVCVEIVAGASVPRAIPVKMKDGSIVMVKVKLPWMPASCSACKVFGHSSKQCTEVHAGNAEWKPKEPLLPPDDFGQIGDQANGSVKSLGDISRLGAVPVDIPVIADQSGEVLPDAPVSELVADAVSGTVVVETVVADNLVIVGAVGNFVDSVPAVVEDFPPLGSPLSKGKARGRGRNKVSSGSGNRFDALQSLGSENVIEVKQPRAASLGVATLLQEMRSKKNDKLKSKVPGSKGTSLSLSQ
ncbi:hypothetical protein HRI_000623400 [Hibiscus trionum]|uniref:DUF4283 domain-containing protein n=1 Tax=Hibiscus trionum TaxID=183268 RepID=A0A9W7H2V9_HIBTR|nr:hypothetical protein HRI_000623400 [Hibiscus trionum]